MRESGSERGRRVEIALLTATCLALAVLRIATAATATPVRMFDSGEYLTRGTPRTKPPLGAWIMSLFGSDDARAVGLAVVGAVASTVLLTALFTTITHRPLRWVTIGVAALWMASGYGRLWDGVVLPESLGISVGIVAVAAVVVGLTRPSRSALAAAGVLAVAMPLIRETLAVQAVAIVGLVAWGLLRHEARQRERIVGIVAVVLVLVGLVGALRSVGELGSGRYDVGYVDTTAEGFRTANVIWRRFAVVDPGWLAGESIDVPADYRPPLIVPTYFDDRANVVSAERGGTSLVLRFLAAHPVYAVRAPFTDEQGISFDRSLLDTYDPHHHLGHGLVDRGWELLGRGLGITLAVVTLLLVAWRPWRGPVERVGPALLALASMAATMLAWHLDGIEALRHVTPSLGVWLATMPFAIAAWWQHRVVSVDPDTSVEIALEVTA